MASGGSARGPQAAAALPAANHAAGPPHSWHTLQCGQWQTQTGQRLLQHQQKQQQQQQQQQQWSQQQ